jgi:DNA segregation ATPase FtsK/SpoIIIE-like protein
MKDLKLKIKNLISDVHIKEQRELMYMGETLHGKNKAVVRDLAAMPHTLVHGLTMTGKSTTLASLLNIHLDAIKGSEAFIISAGKNDILSKVNSGHQIIETKGGGEGLEKVRDALIAIEGVMEKRFALMNDLYNRLEALGRPTPIGNTRDFNKLIQNDPTLFAEEKERLLLKRVFVVIDCMDGLFGQFIKTDMTGIEGEVLNLIKKITRRGAIAGISVMISVNLMSDLPLILRANLTNHIECKVNPEGDRYQSIYRGLADYEEVVGVLPIIDETYSLV